ncbi:MAG TPA: hypothetical protein PL042_01735 [Caldisericia bacterium]|nr:hypothetical protein [Caldisericia bacterium]
MQVNVSKLTFLELDKLKRFYESQGKKVELEGVILNIKPKKDARIKDIFGGIKC